MKPSDAQRAVQVLFDRLVAEGRERGLQAAVYFRGELVVDAWAGATDATGGQAVTGDTLFPVFSCGKGVTATIIHRLVERGALAYERPVADAWPEFAANGKAGVTLKQVLNHTAGLHLLAPRIARIPTGDWDAVCAELAAMAPAYEPGSRRDYHAITQGWILGETARRATGKTFEELLESEIRAPLGLKNMFIGLPDAEAGRVATLEEIGPEQEFPEENVAQAIPNWVQPLYAWMNRADVRRACVPASNGIMTMRDLARHYAALCPGGVDGVELLSPARVAKATEQVDAHLPTTMGPRGLGYGLGSDDSPMGRRKACFGHAGHGGSIGFADPENRLAVAVVRNRLRDPDGVDTPRRVADVVREALGIAA